MDVEKWVQVHSFPVDGNKNPDQQRFVIRVADLRELLNGRILCDAEPVAWEVEDWAGYPEATRDADIAADYEDKGMVVVPLYKAAEYGEG